MEESDLTRAKRILTRLHKLGLQPIRIAKVYYPYRSWYLMRRVLINEKFSKEDLVAWEQALYNFRKKRIYEAESNCIRTFQIGSEGKYKKKKARSSGDEGYD